MPIPGASPAAAPPRTWASSRSPTHASTGSRSSSSHARRPQRTSRTSTCRSPPARLEPELSAGRPLRADALTVEDELRLRGYRFLSQKPVLVVLNIDEGTLAAAAELEMTGRSRYGQAQADVAALGGKIEAELAQLSEGDAALFMEDLGIAEPSRGRVIRLTYELLG